MLSFFKLSRAAPGEEKSPGQLQKEQEEQSARLQSKNQEQKVRQNRTQERHQTATKARSCDLNLKTNQTKAWEGETHVLEKRKREREARWAAEEMLGGDAPNNEPAESAINPNTKTPTVIVDGKAIPLPETVQQPETPDQNSPATTQTWRKAFLAILRAHLLVSLLISGIPSTGASEQLFAGFLHRTIIGMLSHFPEPVLKLILVLVNQSGYTIIAGLFVTSVIASFALYALGYFLLTFVRNPRASFRYLRAKYERVMIGGLRVENALNAYWQRCIDLDEYRNQWLAGW
ncbi:hypothetical protein Vi05172_g995 [Venturia inaequalis]|nr:hypothetical protein Vi05172_g995 [Venturia inaequalis]